MIALGRTIAALLAVAFEGNEANASDPTGVWHTEGQQAQVRIGKCAEAICGTIITLRDPINPATGKPQTDTENEDASKRNRPVIGLQVLVAMKPTGPDSWSGQVYSPEEGKTVIGNLTFKNANTLRLEGCLLGGLLCRSEAWTRSK